MINNREHKGKSIIDFPTDYIILDIETTGLSPYNDSIIEISALKICDNIIADKFSTLVNEGDTYVDFFITELTGITQNMVDTAPNISDILPDFCKFVGNSIIVGQNISFDINFMYDCILKYQHEYLSNNHVDIARISRKLFPNESHHRLQDIALRYRIRYDNAHRAENDCLITYEAYKCLHKDVINIYKSESEFIALFEAQKGYLSSYGRTKASNITTSLDRFDIFHPLYKKNCVFTGELKKMSRKEAMQHVVDIRGYISDNVTKKTNYLVLGDYAYCNYIKDGKSSKHKKAEEYKLQGCDIEIIPESLFYDMIESESDESLEQSQVGNYKIELLGEIKRIISENRLPSNSIQLHEQINNKNKGEYLLQIFEEDWPNPSKGVLSSILILKEENTGKYQGSIKLIMKSDQFNEIKRPVNMISILGTGDTKTIRFAKNESELIPYIREHILYKLSRYKSSHGFGCCSRFMKCSDEKQCIHDNLLYSKGCKYRSHLDQGEIFYGKNRNID